MVSLAPDGGGAAALSFRDVLGFDPEQLQQIFRICNSANGSCADLHETLHGLNTLHTWDGPAAKAAQDSVGKTRVDIDSHRHEVSQVGTAALHCYEEGVALKKDALDLQQEADACFLTIDPAGIVTEKLHVPFDNARQTLIANLQARVHNIVAAATRFDQDLAVLIEGADGQLPLTPPGAPGENELDRRANQLAAFRAAYHRDPLSENDWRMADALDPHTYDPKYQGVKANITTVMFDPITGAGVYRQNMYIPSADVHNVFNLFDNVGFDGFFPENKGDNRGPSSTVSAEESRVSFYADMDNGILVGRQNPTIGEDGRIRAGDPTVRAVQGNDGSLAIHYEGTDALAPPGAEFFPVMGDMTLTPTGRGNIAAGGSVTSYPSVEGYQYKPDGTTTTLISRQATMSPWGPLENLPRGENTHIGKEAPSVVAQVPHYPDDPNMLSQTDRQPGHVPKVTGHIPGELQELPKPTPNPPPTLPHG
ncbi:hypothetical protein D5S18_26295 [Nocardia panacis]|uniref:DUF4226 domain-containing protein n=1 Tax=Nocardia panacis TaxID=2340916 RepID=A0A3A4K7P9_9NOCA|nr:hypothetical protein [Nocardia panacis]RJO70717.1 hypothetical protein D5S18_26295 [Nocardia panacis]